MLTEAVVPLITTVLVVPVTVASLEEPDIVIVVVRSSKVTSAVLSGIPIVVVTGSKDTAVIKSEITSSVEIEVRVKIVLISGRTTIESVLVSTAKIVHSVPSLVSIDSAPLVHDPLDSVMVILVMSVNSVPSVHELVVPGMATSVVEPPLTDALTLSGIIVETVTMLLSSLV